MHSHFLHTGWTLSDMSETAYSGGGLASFCLFPVPLSAMLWPVSGFVVSGLPWSCQTGIYDYLVFLFKILQGDSLFRDSVPFCTSFYFRYLSHGTAMIY